MAFQFDLTVTGINVEQANDMAELFINWVGIAGGNMRPGLAKLGRLAAGGLHINQVVVGLDRPLVELVLDGVIQLAEVYGGQVGGGFAEMSNEQPLG